MCLPIVKRFSSFWSSFFRAVAARGLSPFISYQNISKQCAKELSLCGVGGLAYADWLEGDTSPYDSRDDAAERN